MKKIILVSAITLMMSASLGFADNVTAKFGVCWDTYTKILYTTHLIVNDAAVELSYGSSEPNFSSQLQINIDTGDVILLRKGKPSILVGTLAPPLPTQGCIPQPFVWNPNVKVKAEVIKGVPYPHCSFEKGCTTLSDEKTRVLISSTPGELIVFTGSWAVKP